ncbi:MAG: hypothetical protein BGP13_06045 [Sphingobacteriales bacterium 40-81]|nr:MAG: hypothetical protein BGP13_06045 [Sphingobacteriales bacterium 40-81]
MLNNLHAQINQELAQEYFKEANELCIKDNGKLWGVSICGPMVMYDIASKTIATSEPEPNEKRPGILGVVNAPMQWGGKSWGAYIWNDVATKTPRDRKELLLHELFHGVQPQLGLGVATDTPEHLDEVQGRYWMRLEWRALALALKSTDKKRKIALSDALAFRQERQKLYPKYVNDEKGQEITEGLAAYTATKLVATSDKDAIARALDLLENIENTALTSSFVRTFAYFSGPAYGVLLDNASKDWRKRIKGTDDIAAFIAQAFKIQASKDVSTSIIKYKGEEVLTSEQQREKGRQEKIENLRKTFVDGPVLIFPGGSHSFDSRGAIVIPGEGTIYFGPFKASGPWGSLDATKGVLVSSDGSKKRVAAPIRVDEKTFKGDGWTLIVGNGWIVKEIVSQSKYEVVKKE